MWNPHCHAPHPPGAGEPSPSSQPVSSLLETWAPWGTVRGGEGSGVIGRAGKAGAALCPRQTSLAAASLPAWSPSPLRAPLRA